MSTACSSLSETGQESEPESSVADSTSTSTTEPDTGEGSTTVPDSATTPPASDDDPGASDDSIEQPDTVQPDEDLPERLGEPLPDREVVALVSMLEGQLAIGSGPELLTARPDGLTLESVDGSEFRIASQPTWSHSGQQLAWSAVGPEQQVVAVQEFAADGTRQQAWVESDASGAPVYYLQWNADETQLAYLRQADRGRSVEAGTIEVGRPIVPVDDGVPYFVSWGPEPNLLASYVDIESLRLFDSDARADGFEEILSGNGQFTAPAWVDESTILMVVAGQLALVDITNGEVENIVETNEPTEFVLSPDRTKVAYQNVPTATGITQASLQVQSESDSEEIALVVLDLETGEQVIVADEIAIAWEWSPDSDKLAWLSLEDEIARQRHQWHFWSASGEGIATLETPYFRGSRKEFLSYQPFFAQYTQSITRWSPDSTAFVFAGSIRSRPGIWMQLVAVPAEPAVVAQGDFVTWGYGPTPEPVGGGATSPA